MIEALACGTPVIATPCGAAPELVEHDTTGYIADTITGLAQAVSAIDRIDRQTCRQHAEMRFSMQRMAGNHETLYHRLIHS
jgi:glycosyltransferase involved in cell wall biosynthesis